jgi:hypothetical protein
MARASTSEGRIQADVYETTGIRGDRNSDPDIGIAASRFVDQFSGTVEKDFIADCDRERRRLRQIENANGRDLHVDTGKGIDRRDAENGTDNGHVTRL